MQRELDPLTSQVEAIYRAIVRVTGAHLIVDASKNVVFGALMADRAGIDARTVQLVRDPRATAYSWSQPKPNPGDGEGNAMWSAGVVRSSAFWSAQNLALAWLDRQSPDRFVRLRYEDLIADPVRSLAILEELTGVDVGPGVRIDETTTVSLHPTHSAWGNADRFSGTEVTLARDDRWQTGMSRRDAWLASIIAAPVGALMGYPLRPPRGARRRS